ncbi:MAG TPA: hypothetical protein ENK48_06745 [Gammaproteobacteria bacterium]|nr:hypothetical protein [Gammaproteobacteria bacterium]
MKLLLYMTGTSLTAYAWQGGDLRQGPAFAADEDGVRRFEDYLVAMPEVPVYILTDLTEEEFRSETLPRLLGRDRQVLQQRHCKRLFRSTPYRHSLRLGRSSTEKRKDEVLFSALTNPQPVDMWLEVLLRARRPVAGLHSLPLFSPVLLEALAQDCAKILLLTQNCSGGLRQTFFENGRLRFSRLATVPAPEDPAYPAALMEEISKTRRYLGSLHYLGPDEALEVCIVSGGSALSALAQEVAGTRSTYYHLVAVSELAQRLGITKLKDGPCSDQLFLSLLARGCRRCHYGREDQRRGYRTYHMRRALRGTAALLLFMGVLGSGLAMSDAWIYRQQAQAALQQAARFQAAREGVAARLPRTEASATDIAAAVHLADWLREHRHLPAPLLASVSGGLGKVAIVRLDAIEWQDVVPMGGEVAQEDGGAGFQHVLVKGRITPFHGDYLHAHETVARLASALRRQPGISDVQVLKLPLNVSPASSVEGRFGRDVAAGRAEFSLRVTMRNDDHELL